KLNVRCNPQDVIITIKILNERQRQAVARKGFSNILDMTLDALGSRSHLRWLMDKLDHKDMTIRPGVGKELKITKETVHLILGLPNAGGGKPLGIDEAVAGNNLRAELGLSKDEFVVASLQDRLRKGNDDDLSIRCFFLILFNRLLFPTSSWGISNHEVLLMEEMDRFHETDCPPNKRGTPRIKFFDKNIIQALTKADKRKPRQSGEPFGHCEFRSFSETCYSAVPSVQFQSEHRDRTNIFDVPRPDPCGHHTIHIQLPLIKDMLSSYLPSLSFIQFMYLTLCIYQFLLFKYYDFLITEAHIHKGTQNTQDLTMPYSQPNTELTGTQFEEIHEKQQQMRRAFEGSPDDLETNTTPNAEKQGGDIGASHDTPTYTGPLFDQTPSGHVADGEETHSLHTTHDHSLPRLTELDCARSLRDFLCSSKPDPNRKIIEFDECIGNCLDIQQSFADGMCLDNVFMQCFIMCFRDDEINNCSSINKNRLVLDVNVGTLLNFEEHERYSNSPQIFDQTVLDAYLDKTLSQLDNFVDYKTIMVPILHMGHWTLYVINIQFRCIHILDSNPYGPELGGTSWKMFHYSQKDIGSRKLPWARVIMNRLNKSLQQVRPNSRIPKFGNFPIDMPPMCPTMIAGSNDCGFFVMRYIQYYDYMDGSIKQFIQR
ncbi:hypothetical protein ACJX0J_041596, partial [Zea mays]